MPKTADRTVQEMEASRLRSSINNHEQAVELISKSLGAVFCAQKSGQRACPACGRPMLRRTSKKGSEPHSQFWGCTAYPTCKTVIAIES